jgi:hypothetical protein
VKTPWVEIKLYADTGLGGTLTSFTDANGVATFTDVRPTTVGTGFKLTAVSGDMAAKESTAFAVTASTFSTLAFTTQPAGPYAIADTITVEVTA